MRQTNIYIASLINEENTSRESETERPTYWSSQQFDTLSREINETAAWDDGKSSSCVKGRKSERQHLEFGKHERTSVFIRLDGLTRYNLNQINLIGFELVSTTDLFHFKLKSNYLKH